MDLNDLIHKQYPHGDDGDGLEVGQSRGRVIG